MTVVVTSCPACGHVLEVETRANHVGRRFAFRSAGTVPSCPNGCAWSRAQRVAVENHAGDLAFELEG